jgi:HSP20 family protein
VHQASNAGHAYPPVDILESGDAYLIRAALPGMKKEDISLESRDGAVTLSGERKFDELAAGVEYHRAECVAAKFSRSFYLPQTTKQEETKATYRDGILEIHIPKADEAKARQIAITVN